MTTPLSAAAVARNTVTPSRRQFSLSTSWYQGFLLRRPSPLSLIAMPFLECSLLGLHCAFVHHDLPLMEDVPFFVHGCLSILEVDHFNEVLFFSLFVM